MNAPIETCWPDRPFGSAATGDSVRMGVGQAGLDVVHGQMGETVAMPGQVWLDAEGVLSDFDGRVIVEVGFPGDAVEGVALARNRWDNKAQSAAGGCR